MIPAAMFDRYLIYQLKGRNLHVRLPLSMGGQEIAGHVTSVYRDVMRHRIELVVGGLVCYVEEPTLIGKNEQGHMLFIYGEPPGADDDERVFALLREHSASGSFMDDVLAQTSGRGRLVVTLALTPTL